MKNAVLLSVMMFLQFMMLPVWFVPMFPYVQALPDSGSWVVWCGLIMGFGTFTSPLFGMFADRFLNAEKVLAICNFIGAALLLCASAVRSPAVMFVVLLGAMCFYMPTWSLTATIALAHSTKRTFPRIRVFGTVGWVASSVFSLVGAKCFGIADFDSTSWIFVAGAAVSLAAALFSFLLPATEPVAKGTPMSVSDALGLKALVLFKDASFRTFAILLLLAMLPFQWYNVYCGAYLKETGFQYLTLTMNLGQAGEIGFMLLVPVIIGRFGSKTALMIALAALALRNLCFFGATQGSAFAFLDFGGILIHGLIFGILIVGSQMFIDEVAPKELRNQAQGLVNLLTAGVGVFASNFLFDAVLSRGVAPGAHNWPVAYVVAIALASLAFVAVAAGFKTRK